MALIDDLNKKIETHGTGFKKNSGTSSEGVQGVFIPIEIEHNGGKMRAYLQFPGEFANDYESFKNLIQWVEERYDIPTFKKNYGSNNGFKKYNKYSR